MDNGIDNSTNLLMPMVLGGFPVGLVLALSFDSASSMSSELLLIMARIAKILTFI